MNYEPILKKFCLDESEVSRFAISEVFTSGDWTAGTDGWHMACVPKDVLSVPTDKLVPNPKAIFEAAKYRRNVKIEVKNLRSQKLERLLNTAPIAPRIPVAVFEPCDRCRATGTCLCDCRGEHACSKCYGRKEVETLKSKLARERYSEALEVFRSGKIEIPPVRLCGSVFNYRLIRNVREACQQIKAKTLTVQAYGGDGVLIAKADKMHFAVMPMRLGSDSTKCIELG